VPLEEATLKVPKLLASIETSIEVPDAVEYVHVLELESQNAEMLVSAHSPQTARVGTIGHEQLAVSQFGISTGASVAMMPLYIAALVDSAGTKSLIMISQYKLSCSLMTYHL
jgi:hypothetical protein